jgi:hypothetical protein
MARWWTDVFEIVASIPRGSADYRGTLDAYAQRFRERLRLLD